MIWIKLISKYIFWCNSGSFELSHLDHEYFDTFDSSISLFVDALWSPAGRGLTCLLSFVMSNCDVVTFPSVSLVRCGAWLYRFLIFVLFFTLSHSHWYPGSGVVLDCIDSWCLYPYLLSLPMQGIITRKDKLWWNKIKRPSTLIKKYQLYTDLKSPVVIACNFDDW